MAVDMVSVRLHVVHSTTARGDAYDGTHIPTLLHTTLICVLAQEGGQVIVEQTTLPAWSPQDGECLTRLCTARFPTKSRLKVAGSDSTRHTSLRAVKSEQQIPD